MVTHPKKVVVKHVVETQAKGRVQASRRSQGRAQASRRHKVVAKPVEHKVVQRRNDAEKCNDYDGSRRDVQS